MHAYNVLNLMNLRFVVVPRRVDLRIQNRRWNLQQLKVQNTLLFERIQDSLNLSAITEDPCESDYDIRSIDYTGCEPTTTTNKTPPERKRPRAPKGYVAKCGR